MESFLVDLMVVFVSAVFFGIGFRFFKLPSIVGQVLAGFVMGMWGVLGLSSVEAMKFLSTLGVTLLLFLVGLEMNWKDIRHSGKTVFKLFVAQTILLSGVFVIFAIWVLGLSWLPALLLSIALTFSSTIVVVKTLSEGKDIKGFVGKLSLGMLLLQDLLAIVLLALIPGLKEGLSSAVLSILFLKIAIILLVVN
ncbi:MAG: Sodium/hydrogen exchanger, partial [Candidatus Collierbacteria bacterium GW2011_GWB1_45_35]